MANPSLAARSSVLADRLPTLIDLPILYQEEEDDGMGEMNLHAYWAQILDICLGFHFVDRPGYRVFTNLNVYYLDGPPHPVTGQSPNVAPDAMVVRPFDAEAKLVTSYRIGVDGPPPDFAGEVLSPRTARKRDLGQKLDIYRGLGIPEYLIADPLGRHVKEKVLLKRLRPDRTWEDCRDPDGGATSQLGFRVIVDDDGHIRFIDAVTGKRYVRPDEGQREADTRLELEDKVRALETEILRLRGGDAPTKTPRGKKGSRRKP